LASDELIFLLTELVKENIIGLDIMELTPRKDFNHETAHLAAELIIEFVVRDFFKKS